MHHAGPECREQSKEAVSCQVKNPKNRADRGRLAGEFLGKNDDVAEIEGGPELAKQDDSPLTNLMEEV